MLAHRRGLVVEPEDRVVGGLHDPSELSLVATMSDDRRTPCPGDQRIAFGEQSADLFVGLDPRRREVRALEHSVGQRPLARR